MVDLVFAPPTNVTTFAQKIAYIDGLTNVGFGGMLGIMMLIVIFGILIMMMKSFKFETIFAPAAFITAFCGILIRILLPINNNVIYISIILFVIGLLYLIKESHGQEV